MAREYSLNDIGFTPGAIEPRPIGSVVEYIDETELREHFKRNREEAERLLQDFEERTKDMVVRLSTPITRCFCYIVLYACRKPSKHPPCFRWRM